MVKMGCTHYWPIINGTMYDCIGGKDMMPGSLYTFSNDRNILSGGSLDFTQGGYTKFPPGVYFNSSFSISVWVKSKSHAWWSRIVDFGTDRNYNVVLSGSGTTNTLSFFDEFLY